MSALEIIEYMEKGKIITPITIGGIFVALSVLIYKTDFWNGFINFLLGLTACFSIITLVFKIYLDGKQTVLFGTLAKYTMPIFVMHTLFAAPLRIILLKVGIQNAVIHAALGITISFIGPIIMALIMKQTKWLEFFLYPGKFIKIKQKRE